MDNGPLVLSGRYEVGELVGRGGMAEVHIGHDARLGRTVAIKILRSDLARDPSFLARFRREAQAAASLNHPAIVAVYDTGEDTRVDATGAETHVPFIVMEYVEGHTVREILRDGQAVPIDEAIEITAGVLAALEYSHHAGIVHRDIKPANVMITPTGNVKVMDFGIARAVADSAATMTQTQAVIGTAQYLSPEQARGETVDARSDLYSTGCLLFELLTGRPPFIGDSPVAVAYQHVREPAPTPSSIAPDVPEVMDRITLKALTKDRDDRYSSAAEFHADLESALRGGTVSAPAAIVPAAEATMLQPAATQLMEEQPPSPWGEQPAPVVPPDAPVEEDQDEEEPRSRRGLMWTLITIAVVAVAAIVTMLLMNGKPDEPTATTAVPPIAAGMSKADAQATIEGLGLVFESVIDPEASGDLDTTTGRTDPGAGQLVEPGSSVKVYLAGTPGTVNVPNVEGMSQGDAKKAITDADLVWGTVTTEDSPDVPKDNVISSDPGPGQTVETGSTVNIVLSSGKVAVPSLAGSSRENAEAQLAAVGLTASFEEIETADAAAGTVAGQSPAANTSVAQGSSVTVQIAKAPPEETVQVPNVVNMTIGEAEEAIDDAGLTVGNVTEQSSSSVPEDKVISMSPTPGTQLKPGDRVDLVVSTGKSAGGNGNSPGTGNGNAFPGQG